MGSKKDRGQVGVPNNMKWILDLENEIENSKPPSDAVTVKQMRIALNLNQMAVLRLGEKKVATGEWGTLVYKRNRYFWGNYSSKGARK